MTTQEYNATTSDWRKSPNTRFFQDGDDMVKPLRDALTKQLRDVEEDTWRVGVLRELRKLVDTRLPWPLPAPSRPGEGEQTPSETALHYRVAAEFVCRFQTQDAQEYKSFVSTGMLLDLWDIWRKAGSQDEIERRPLEQAPPLRDGTRRVVNPALILDALCGCDRDLAFLLRENGDYGAENALREQMRWQLRCLYRSENQFSKADRAVLYELLRHDHYRFSDADTHLPENSVKRVILAAKQFRTSIENFGDMTLPDTPEVAFADDPGGQEQQDWTIDALKIFFAHGASIDNQTAFDTLPKRLYVAAKKLDVDVDEASLRQMLLFWAARSRIIRMALDDLLNHRFPKMESRPPEQQKIDTDSGCDCWIAVTGYRQVGKTSFMAALTAALLPDETPLDGDLEKVEWSESRARIIETSAFKQAGTRDETVRRAAQKVGQLIGERLRGVETQGTPEEIQHIAEVDTAYLARLRFFDLPGEHLYDETTGEMNDQTEEMIKRRGPVAAIFLESANKDDRQLDRRRFLPQIVGPAAPIYIVMNKYDAFRDMYKGKAKLEITSSLSYEDTPMECDADYGLQTEPFFSLRQLDLQREDVTNHQDIIKRLDDIPSVVRRPHYHARLAADIEQLGWLFDDYLLKWGNRDISIAYLVSTLDGRTTPKEFIGLRRLWQDIEYRVVESTRNLRRSALRRLLIETPVEAERRATKAYDSFNLAFDHEANSETQQVGQLPNYWTGFKERITEGLNRLQQETQVRRQALLGTTSHTPEQATIEALEEVKKALAYSRDIASKQARLSAIKSALRAFLPECGINPNSHLGEIPVILRVQALESIEQDKLLNVSNELCEQIQESLKGKDISFDDNIGHHVYRLLETIITELREDLDPNEDQDSKKGNKFRVDFDIRDGVEHPKGHPGHSVPIRDNTLNLHQRKILSNNITLGQTVAETILSQTSADDALALVLSLYNTDESHRTRYPELMLRKGDVDFSRVRVLSEQHQLGERIREFREKAVDAMELLVQAHERIQHLDADSFSTLKMLRLIDARIFGGKLGIGDVYSTSSEDKSNKIPVDLRERVTDQHENAKELRGVILAVLDSNRLFGRNWDQVRDIGIEQQKTWYFLDAESRPSMTSRWRRKVIKARTRIEVKVHILEELEKLVKIAKGLFAEEIWIEEENMENRLQLDAVLRHKLMELRLVRRLLIGEYPLKYLFESQWIQSAKDAAAREVSEQPSKENEAVAEIADKLEQAWQALNRMSLRFGVADTQAKDWLIRGAGNGDCRKRIGSPDFPFIGIRDDEETGREWMDDDQGNWMALCEALGLWEVWASEHPLWRCRS